MAVRIVGISGSVRRGSYNSAVLRVAGESMPGDSEMIIETIEDIPLYNANVEAEQGVPEAVARIKDAIAAADGLLLVSPEYNNSVPGVAKNAIDWLSRPPKDVPRVFGGKPVAIAGASPGGFGTILSQNAWLPVFRTLGAQVWSGGRLLVSRAGSVVDANGAITTRPRAQISVNSRRSLFSALAHRRPGTHRYKLRSRVSVLLAGIHRAKWCATCIDSRCGHSGSTTCVQHTSNWARLRCESAGREPGDFFGSPCWA